MAMLSFLGIPRSLDIATNFSFKLFIKPVGSYAFFN